MRIGSTETNKVMKEGRPNEAIDLFRESITADPSYLSAYFGLNDILRQIDEIEESYGVLGIPKKIILPKSR